MYSTVKLSKHSYVTISLNTALINGGGLFLQENSKLYLLKKKQEKHTLSVIYLKLSIFNNSASYGGGIYVADNSTTAGLHCQGNMKLKDKYDGVSVSPECFIQTIQLFQSKNMEDFPFRLSDNKVNTYIINNVAESGSALYGGLLDRCTISPLAEIYEENVRKNGVHYIYQTVKFSKNSSITSDPVQIIFVAYQKLNLLLEKDPNLW